MRVRIAERQRVVEQPALDVGQQVVERALDCIEAKRRLLPRVASHDRYMLGGQVARTDLDTQGHPAQLVIGELVPGSKVVAVVHLHTQTVRAPFLGHRLRGAEHLARARRRCGRSARPRPAPGRPSGQAQAPVVAVSHDQPADEAGRHAPRGRERVVLLAVAPEVARPRRLRRSSCPGSARCPTAAPSGRASAPRSSASRRRPGTAPRPSCDPCAPGSPSRPRPPRDRPRACGGSPPRLRPGSRARCALPATGTRSCAGRAVVASPTGPRWPTGCRAAAGRDSSAPSVNRLPR